ncbi:MAG: FAD-linked oxidase C-terminal domain-containing protein [Gaiellaceae bacterium]
MSSAHTKGHIQAELARIVGPDAVLPGTTAAYLSDETEGRGVRGRADAVVLPSRTEDVAAVLAWCYAHDVPVIPRGGGTGFAGGAVPLEGGIVLALERLNRIRSFDPLLWRISVEAGVRTGDLRRLAREHGLMFPPDPGAAEQSEIGGNIATNAGGPHAFKYGVTGAWVSGLEAVVPPGEVVTFGGPIRKDVAGYDIKSLLVGSEGTLGIITAAWLRLLPAPEAAFPTVAFYAEAGAGCTAIERVLGSGLQVAALEFLDGATLEAAGGSFPGAVPADVGFMVIAEADGSKQEAERLREEVVEILSDGALGYAAETEPQAVAALWRWRDGVSIAVTTKRGGKVSEDIVVPLDRLGEAIEETIAIGLRHGLPACSWGHAGDGNLHSTFLIAPDNDEELSRATLAADELFALAARLGGSISGEHGIGWVKRGQLARQWGPHALALHAEIKRVFDPKGLLNPGKKLAA